MTIENLSLPLDIPWERLCTSEDMIDKKVCDRKFPYRWRSSVTVFSYEPPEEYQNYDDQIISYLKVACTITGFQPDPEEVGLLNRRIDSYWNDPRVIENYKDVVSKYYGSYGAILEVAISPAGSREEIAKIPLSKYPYFADFQPKKRELYESVSETGEVMSRSLDNINVRKGTTTTDQHEVLDVFGGLSTNFQYAGTGGGASITGQWGTRDLTKEEYQNIRTTDHAREMRETYSHTTQLSQMYHQFSSYHLGTNRAVFFMLPRPHIVQSEYTFVNGPRLLEGIQEIFLVVMRPKDIKKICVEAYLETAHIASEPQLHYDESADKVTLHVERGCDDTSGSFGDDSNTRYAEGSETYAPPDGWEIDLGRDGGYKIDSVSGTRIEGTSVLEVASDHITIWGKVSSHFVDRTWPESNVCYKGRLDMVVTVYIRKKKPDIIGYDQNLIITGRGVCCCNKPDIVLKPSDWVVAEIPMGVSNKVAIDSFASMSVSDANHLRAQVGRVLVNSKNHPDRYPFGQVTFADSQFVARVISRIVRQEFHPDNQPLQSIKGLDDGIKKKVAKIAPNVSRGRLLEMSINEQMDRFGLEFDDVINLRRATIGTKGPEVPPKDRWDRPGPKVDDTVEVQNVVGDSLNEAISKLQEIHLYVDDINYVDSKKPRNTVLSQEPTAGTSVPVGSDIDLAVASGAGVSIPRVIGKKLSVAKSMLKRAGLESEPQVVYEDKCDIPRDHVIAVEPEVYSNVTPHASVTLKVSSAQSPKSSVKAKK